MLRSEPVSTDDLPPLVLVGQPNPDIRKRALKGTWHGSTLPEEVLALLDWDADLEVRFAAAAARSGNEEKRNAFDRLSVHPETATHDVFRNNPLWMSAPALRNSPLWREPQVRAKVARYAEEWELLRPLVRDSVPEVRLAAASNERLWESLLAVLERDQDRRVASAAKATRDRHVETLRERAMRGKDDSDLYASWSLAVHDVLTTAADNQEAVLGEVVYASLRMGDQVATRVLSQPWVPSELLGRMPYGLRLGSPVFDTVAANPHTPPDVLDIFTREIWGEDSAHLALRNPGLDPDTLRSFAEANRVNRWTTEAVWSNPALPEDFTHSIPRNLPERVGLAQNTATPGHVLSSLAMDEEPWVRHKVAQNPATPASVLMELSSRPSFDHDLVVCLTRNPSTPRSALESLLLRDASARKRVAQSENTPADLLVSLLGDADIGVRLAAVYNPATPQAAVDAVREDRELLEADNLFEHNRRSIKYRNARENADRAPLRCPTNTKDAAETLIRALDVSSREDLATHSRPFWVLDSEFIQEVLARDPIASVRATVAFQAREPIRRKLAEDEGRDMFHDVIQSVASTTTDPELAAKLVQSERAWLGLVCNPITPTHVLAQIHRRTDNFEWKIRDHPNATPTLLAELAGKADDSGELSRARLAEHPETAADVLAALASDAAASVRRAVAAHPATPSGVLADLAHDGDARVRIVIAMNRHTTPETLVGLSADPDTTVRRLVASNTNTPAAGWARLVVDSDPTTRSLATKHLTPPTQTRRHLASGSDTSPDVLHLLALDADPEIRLAVAGNGRTPPPALEELATDDLPTVRLTVARRADTPQHALILLTKDQKWRVRRAARSTKRRAP